MQCGRAAAHIERRGIPTVVITREGFADVVASGFAESGFSAEAAQVVYDAALFLPGADASRVTEKLDAVTAALTTWTPKQTRKGRVAPAPIEVEAGTESDARAQLEHLLAQRLYTDGLPVVPPTPERVDWVLRGTERDRGEVLGRVAPRGGAATVEQVAVSLAMAGGRPEYLPVTLAAVEAMVEPAFAHGRMNTTTCSVYPVFVVSGSVAREIRVAFGYGLLGPNPRFPAGAAIGRAVRFVLQNVGGARPGETTMSIFGGPARFTGLVFAEDGAGVPDGWSNLAEEQGHHREANLVTAYAVASTTNIPGGEAGTPEAATASLNRAAGTIGVPNANYWFLGYKPAGLLLVGRGTARGLAALGWSKERVQTYLWEHSKVPGAELGPRTDAWWMPPTEILEDPMPVSERPEGIRVVVAGGEQSGHMMWLQVGCCPESLVSVPVHKPNAWRALLEEAREELGPVPASAAGEPSCAPDQEGVACLPP